MALGTDGLITVVGDFDTLDGSPVSGKVTVTPSVEIRRGAITYPQLPTVVPLDADGKFSLKLPASDDPAVTPNGFTYRFDVAVSASVAGRSVTDTSSTNFALPVASANTQGIAQLSTLAPAPEVGTPSVFLTRAVADLRYAFKGEGGGSGGGIDAAGVRALVKSYLVQGANVTLTPNDNAGTLTISATGTGGGSQTITISSITDATTVGKAVLAAANAASARTAIGAGTSSLVVGTGPTDAKRGDYVPTWAELGTIPTSALPPLAINDVFTVASQSAMLALTAQRGDMAIRTDTGSTFVLASDSPSTLADWKAISAAGSVGSVNGKTGTVVLAPSDIAGLATVATSGSYTDLANKPTIPTVPTLATVATSGSYADLSSKPTIPAAYTDTQARTAVSTVGYLSPNDLEPVTLSKVATTGVSTDLIRRPVTRNEPGSVPTLTKRLDLVIGTTATIGLPTIYVSHMLRVPDSVRAAYPQYGKWRVYTSTDHDSGAGGIAIGISTNDDPLVAGDWTWLRKASAASMYDEGSTRQTETPNVVFDKLNNRFLMYYQVQVGNFQGATVQTTRVVYSTDGVTNWSAPVDAIKNQTDTIVGSNHTGYLRAYNLDGLYVGWHLQGAGSPNSSYGWSFSYDGINWVTDPHLVGAAVDLTDGVLRLGISSLYEWGGRLWAIGTQSEYVSGSNTSGTTNAWTAPINLEDDLRSLRGRPQRLTWNKDAAETANAGLPGSFATMDDGRLVGAYRFNGATGSLGLVVLA